MASKGTRKKSRGSRRKSSRGTAAGSRYLPSRRSQARALSVASGVPSSGKKGVKGVYRRSLYSPPIKETYDSSYELTRFKQLDRDPTVRNWTKSHGIRLPYYDLKLRKMRMYVPDILVELKDGSRRLEEIKGYVRDEWNFKVKCALARAYCRSASIKFVVLFKEDLEKQE